MTKEVGERTILCFDFGTKSIGVAVGNEITGSATALTAIKAKDGKPDQNVLDKYFKDWCSDIIVVGLPLNMDGTYQELTFRAKKFGNRLANNYKLEVCFKDERLTTTSAREHLFDNRGFKGLKKSNIDCQAAVIILEAFMNGD